MLSRPVPYSNVQMAQLYQMPHQNLHGFELQDMYELQDLDAEELETLGW